MARTQFNAQTYNTKYVKNVAGHLVNRLKAIYDTMYQEAGRIGASTGFSDPQKEFRLSDFPKAEAKIDALLATVSGKVESLIRDGVDSCWTLSGDKNEAMVKSLAAEYGWDEERVRDLSRRSLDARERFKERTVSGMNLSERVWNFVKSDKALLELSMEMGLSEGRSAAELSRDVRSYLQEPNKLFRRVRDKAGNLRLSKAAQAYHPGQGVYRSSYKNALRMTITETSMAYRSADMEAWSNMPFVEGYTVKLSDMHPCDDICDELKGDYPNGFKFVGWHPHCLCFCVAKLASREELSRYSRMTDAEARNYRAPGAINDVPDNFKKWLENNAERVARAKNVPYFIRDNYVDGDPAKGLLFLQKPANPARPERTPQQAAEIQRRWDERHRIMASNELEGQNTLALARSYSSGMDLSRLEDLMRRQQYLQVGDQVAAVMKDLEKVRAAARKLDKHIPGAESLLGQYTIEDLKSNYTAIDKAFKQLQKLSLADRVTQLEALSRNAASKLQQEAYEKRLATARVDLKVEQLQPDLDSIVKAAGLSNVKALGMYADKARQALEARDVTLAEQLIRQGQQVQPLAQRIDDLRKRVKPGQKIDKWLDEADDLLQAGKIDDATKLITEGENLQAKYEHDAALKRAKAAAKKAEEEAAKEAARLAEEAAKLAKKKVDLSKLDYDGLKKELGDEMPLLLANYEKSIARENLTSPEFLKKRKEIERKLKDFFDDTDFGHFEHIEILDDAVLDNGFLNNIQSAKMGGRNKGKGYEESRRAFGHWAYGFQNSMYTTVPNDKRLPDGDYYRCGAPFIKDKTWSFKNQKATQYGTAQVRFRKDQVITTFTLDNSLGDNYIPSLTSAPSVVSLDNGWMKGVDASKYTTPAQIKGGDNDDYLEIQYLPKKGGRLGPEHVESIVLPAHPDNVALTFRKARTAEARAKVWDRWYDYGVDIYYFDSSKDQVVLWRKGKPLETPEQMAARLAAEREARLAKAKLRHQKRDAELAKQGTNAQERAQELLEQRAILNTEMCNKAEAFLRKEAGSANMDINLSLVSDRLKARNYRGALNEANRLAAEIQAQAKREAALVDLIPDVKALHQTFTMQELEDAHAAIKRTLERLSTRSAGDEIKYLEKLRFEVKYLNDPTHQTHRTWKVAQDAYNRAADEQYKKVLGDPLANLKAYKTKDKRIGAALSEAEDLIQQEKFREAKAKLMEAEDLRIQELNAATEKTLGKLGEALGVKFDDEAFSQARKDAALWFKNSADPAAAFDAVDRIMSRYAEDVWGRLTKEEKHVAYLYTSGSKYINEPFYTRYGAVKVGLDGKKRSSENDINVLTSIIEKCKPLEQDMWVQHTEDARAMMGRFGVNLYRMTGADLKKLAGREAVNDGFLSTSCAKDSYFSREGIFPDKDVVLSIYLPKGTKGLYTEPFAHWGDGRLYEEGTTTRYAEKAADWNGKSRQDEGHRAGDQVEFVLQRGSKLRIKNVEYKNGRYYVECELVEQTAVKKFKCGY